MRRDELDAFLEADGTAFGERLPPSVRAWLDPHIVPERVLVSRDGGEIVGSAASELSVMTLPGLHRLETAVVVTVSVIPSHRREGRLMALMRHQLDDLHERGEALATLYASEGGIYGRFGYGMATFGSQYEVDKQVARLDDPARELAGGRIRLVDRARAMEVFPDVYARYAPIRAGEIDRTDIDFRHAAGAPGGDDLGRRFCAVYEEDGRVDGYAGYEVVSMPASDQGPRQVVLHELCSVTDAAYVGLWQFLLGIDLAGELRASGRPVDEPIRWLLTNHRHLRTSVTRDRSWLRLVDVPASLAARGYPHAGTVVLEVVDEFCPWNAGVYRLHVAEDWATGEVEPTTSAADFTLDAASLASVFLGGVVPSALRISGRVLEHTTGALARADRMFANDRAPYCTTNY